MYAFVAINLPASAVPDKKVDLSEYQKRSSASLQDDLEGVLRRYEEKTHKLGIELRGSAETLNAEMIKEMAHEEELRRRFRQELEEMKQKISGSMSNANGDGVL